MVGAVLMIFLLILIIGVAVAVTRLAWVHRNDDYNRELQDRGINPKTHMPYTRSELSDHDLRDAYERGRRDQRDDDDRDDNVKW